MNTSPDRPGKPAKEPVTAPNASKKERQAKALRENLVRRKAVDTSPKKDK